MKHGRKSHSCSLNNEIFSFVYIIFFIFFTNAPVRDFWKLSKQLSLTTLQTLQGKYLVLVCSGILQLSKFTWSIQFNEKFCNSSTFSALFELLVSNWARIISQQTQKMFNYIGSHSRRNIFLFRISMGRTEEFISSIWNIGSRRIILKFCHK